MLTPPLLQGESRQTPGYATAYHFPLGLINALINLVALSRYFKRANNFFVVVAVKLHSCPQASAVCISAMTVTVKCHQ